MTRGASNRRWTVAAVVVAALGLGATTGQAGPANASASAKRTAQVGVGAPTVVAGAVNYGYDANGRLTSVVDPTGATRTLAYDAVGNLTGATASIQTTPASGRIEPAATPAAPSSLAASLSDVKSTASSGGTPARVVVITGHQLPDATTARVKIGNLFAHVRSATATRLVADLPTGSGGGRVDVTVTGEGGTARTALALPVVAKPAADEDASTIPALMAAAGVGAVSGRVRDATTRAPLEGVTLSIDSLSTTSGADGRFLLTGIPGGHHELVIDAAAPVASGDHGRYEVGEDVVAGRTTVMPWTTWLTAVDTAHAVTLPATITKEIVVTSPAVPGLEVHVPPGTTLTDDDGDQVTSLSITKIPLARQPFPGAPGMPLAWTIQPGGATVSGEGLKVVYPNLARQRPGVGIDYVDHDAARTGLGWAVYGHGRVSGDGRQIVPDASTRLHETYQLGISYNPLCQYLGLFCPRPGDNGKDGDPVDLQTGLFVMSHSDLALPDVLPIALTRTYRQNDYTMRSFGIGQNDAFNSFVSPDGAGNYAVQFPDGSSIPFAPTSTSGIYKAFDTPSALTGASMTTDFDQNFTITLVDGEVLTFGGYTASLVATSDRYGDTTTMTRDPSGRLTQVTSPNGRWISLTWGVCGGSSQCIVGAADNLGRKVVYAYDADGRLTSVADPAGKKTTYTWAACADSVTCTEITAITDPLSISYLRNTFDANGRVVTQLQPDGTSYTFAYTLAGDGHANSTTVTDPRGNKRQLTFDASGYTSSDTVAYGTALAQTTTDVRDAAHRITSSTDALARTTTMTYDAVGSVLQTTQLAGTANARTITLSYEPTFHRIASVTNALGKKATFAYDDANQIITVTDPLGFKSTTQVIGGEPVAMTDSLAHTTYMSYLDGDPVAVSDALGRTSHSYYDAGGRLLKATDPLGDRVLRRYDVMNQLVGSTDAMGKASSAAYDADGRLTSTTDALGHVTAYGYDTFGRMITQRDALNASATYTYDANGNVASYQDRNGTKNTYSYDALDRETFEGFKTTVSGGTTTYQSTVTNTYDAGNRLTSAVDTTGGTLSRTYDGFDRLLTETTSQGSLTYTYDAADRMTRMTVTGQPATNYTWDDGNRLTGLTGAAGSVGFTYDAAERRTGLTLPGGAKQTYTYDAANQLTGIAYANATASLGNLSYTYDNAGRRITAGGTLARTGLPAAVGSSTYNADNALLTRGTSTYAYDAEGELTGDGTRTYTWNARHQLTAIAGATTASFTYDPAGRRLTRNAGGVSTGFVYDGENVVQERSGGAATANLLTGARTDETFARTDSAGTRSFLTDALGSTVALTDGTGASVTSYTYDPYGVSTTTGAANSNPMQFTGRENDGTGLYFYRARFYSPSLQRFISQDPAGPAGSGANLYAYTGDSPTNYTDPSGEQLLAGCAVGAVFQVGFGWATHAFSGRKYTWRDAGTDALTGCVMGAAGAWLGKAFAAARAARAARTAATATKAAEGAEAAGAGAARTVARACSTNSFTSSTPVLMADGSKKPIADVKVGERVVATDPQTGRSGSRVVVDLIRHSGSHTMVAVRLADGSTIDATDGHPFWVESRNAWVDAIDLEAGDAVVDADGDWLTVVGVGISEVDLTAYNLTVAGLHTYYAGDDSVLVHNTGCINIADLPSSAVRNLTQDADYAFSRLSQGHGVTRIEFREQIHMIKRSQNLPADFDLSFGPTGDVWNPQTGDLIGHIGHGG